MKIYIVRDSEDRTIECVYDEETFAKEYKKYVSSYWKGHYWERFIDVVCWEVDTENCCNISVQEAEKLGSVEGN